MKELSFTIDDKVYNQLGINLDDLLEDDIAEYLLQKLDNLLYFKTQTVLNNTIHANVIIHISEIRNVNDQTYKNYKFK